MSRAPVAKIENVQVQGVWLPCEYRLKYKLFHILSLGDVERDELPRVEDGATLSEAAANFFKKIPASKRVAVLMPQDSISDQHLWPCRTFFMRDLLAQTAV